MLSLSLSLISMSNHQHNTLNLKCHCGYWEIPGQSSDWSLSDSTSINLFRPSVPRGSLRLIPSQWKNNNFTQYSTDHCTHHCTHDSTSRYSLIVRGLLSGPANFLPAACPLLISHGHEIFCTENLHNSSRGLAGRYDYVRKLLILHRN